MKATQVTQTQSRVIPRCSLSKQQREQHQDELCWLLGKTEDRDLKSMHYAAIWLVLLAMPGQCQTRSPKEFPGTAIHRKSSGIQQLLSTTSVQRPSNCEDVLLDLDEALGMTKKLSDSYLIVIGKQGKSETAIRANQSRLEAIEQYLKRFSNLNYFTAEGGSVEGSGRVELYVGGKLLHAFTAKRNAMSFCSTPVG
jgi:hypothetical protein